MKQDFELRESWILRTLMDNTSDSIYIKDRDCRLMLVSKKMAMDLGFLEPEEIYGKTDIDLFGEEFGSKTLEIDRQVMESGQPVTGQIESYVTKDGITNWTSTTKFPLRNEAGEIIGLLGITREINELKLSEIKSQWLATHDSLTGLENRVLLEEHILQFIKDSQESGLKFALLFVDLNGFKKMNDTFGHDEGDRILRTVARIITDNVRGMDSVSRIGGDEFTVLLKDLHHGGDAMNVAHKIANRIKLGTDPVEHSVTASIGVSVYPDDGETPETLIKKADRAMYIAKESKSGCQKASHES